MTTTEQEREAPLGYVNGRPKTRYEYLLERELDARKTRQGFIRTLMVICAIETVAICVLIALLS